MGLPSYHSLLTFKASHNFTPTQLALSTRRPPFLKAPADLQDFLLAWKLPPWLEFLHPTSPITPWGKWANGDILILPFLVLPEAWIHHLGERRNAGKAQKITLKIPWYWIWLEVWMHIFYVKMLNVFYSMKGPKQGQPIVVSTLTLKFWCLTTLLHWMKPEIHKETADSMSGAGDAQSEFGTSSDMRWQGRYSRLSVSCPKDSGDNMNDPHWPKMEQPPECQ